MTSPLFKQLQLGAISLSHRVVMAPLTRMRAGAPDNVPTELSVECYRQRASSGNLIIAEATQISPTGQGYPATPGNHSTAQVAGWKKVVEQVHAQGGKMEEVPKGTESGRYEEYESTIAHCISVSG